MVLLLFAGSVSNAQETPYSVQMHVHGSLSEGTGSMASHTHEAANANVDVIWWSDHDWRMTYHRHVSSFAFEAASETIDVGEDWTPTRARELTALKGVVPHLGAGFQVREWEISSEQAFSGVSSLKIEGSSSRRRFKPLVLRFASDRGRHLRSLASDVTLELAAYPDLVGIDTRPVVLVALSEHPANAEVPAQAHYYLRYFLSNSGESAWRSDNVYNVPVPFTEAEWNLLELQVSQDAVAGFPFIDGRDNSLGQISFGLESRNGGLGRVYFDDLRIGQLISGNDLLEIQTQMTQGLAGLVPSVVQHVGTEISYEVEHLNEFSPATVLHDWDELASISGLTDPGTGWIDDLPAFREFAASWVVARAHERGGVVSLNHTFGPDGDPYSGTREEKVEDLLATRAFGVDLLEVGYRLRGGRTLDDYLWTWDELAKNGLLLAGTGVSDTHGGPEGHWLSFDNNFVSWIYASSAGLSDLIAGLKGGRVYFGDIALFDGAMDIESDRGFRMGQVVVTDRPDVDLTFSGDGLALGDELRLIEYGQPIGSFVMSASGFDWTRRFSLHPALGSFYRFEVRDASQRAKAFSNPIYFVRQVPEDGLRGERAAIDLGGVHSVVFREFFLTAATLSDQGDTLQLILGGSASNLGEILLDASAVGAPTSVTFEGLAGTWFFDGAVLTLGDLAGDGSVSISFPKTPSAIPPLRR